MAEPELQVSGFKSPGLWTPHYTASSSVGLVCGADVSTERRAPPETQSITHSCLCLRRRAIRVHPGDHSKRGHDSTQPAKPLLCHRHHVVNPVQPSRINKGSGEGNGIHRIKEMHELWRLCVSQTQIMTGYSSSHAPGTAAARGPCGH